MHVNHVALVVFAVLLPGLAAVLGLAVAENVADARRRR
jgi:hypothetical protein